jgi:hypothetical protein
MDNAETTKSLPTKASTTLIAATPSLLGLPPELRLQICGYLFHTNTSNCEDYGFRGCRCGDNACRTNTQLFDELRPLRFNHARFIFKDPTACSRFLGYIGDDCIHLRDVAITFRILHSETVILRDIFSKLKGNNNIRDLQLEIKNEDGSEVSSSPDPPACCPSALERSPALAYDLLMRPSKHPLGDLKSLRALTVIGHPGTGGVEEALFKLSRTIDRLARKEGKTLETQQTQLPCDTWFYRISIEEKVEHNGCQRSTCSRCRALDFFRLMRPGRRWIHSLGWTIHF